MNAKRIEAQITYQSALSRVRAAESGSDAVEYEAAVTALDCVRSALVAAEIQYPTAMESKKQNNLLTLRNRGLDV